MSAIGSFIRSSRLARQWGEADLARLAGLSVEQVRGHEEGAALIAYDIRRRYARALGLSIEQFEDCWRRHMNRLLLTVAAPGKIPVINLSPASEPRNYEEFGPDSGLGFTYVDRSPGQDDATLFGVVVVGRSMTNPAGEPSIDEGDLVICRPAQRLEEVPDGSAVHVRFGPARQHTCTIKSLYRMADGLLELRPYNPNFTSLLTSVDEIARLSLIIECRRLWHPPPRRRVVVDEFAQLRREDAGR